MTFLNGDSLKRCLCFCSFGPFLNAKGHENVQYNLSNPKKLGTKDVYMSDDGLFPLCIGPALNLF